MSDRLANIDGLAKAVAATASADMIIERLTKLGIPPAADGNPEASAVALVRASGIKSQGEAAVLLVNLTGGRCTADQVTAALKAAFPGAKIGARHGPHYLSLARTGKLEGVEASTIPHSARKSHKPATIVTVADSAPAKKASVPAPGGGTSAPKDAAPKPEPAPAADDKAIEGKAAQEKAVADLRARLSALNQKELAAEAKKFGVKAIGKKDDIIVAIIAAS